MTNSKRFPADEAIHHTGQRGPMVVLASDHDAETERLQRHLDSRNEQIDGYERQLGIDKAGAEHTIGSEIERLTRERDVSRAAIEQLHAAVKTAQELAATRLLEKDRIVEIGERARLFLAQEVERLRNIVTGCPVCSELERNIQPSHEPIPCALAHSADVRQEIKGKGDVPNSQFAGILKAAESGDAVNTMDLINALWWRVGNQRKELGRKNADVERLRNDIQEITCGDVRLVCPNCRPEKGAQGASRDASSGDTSVALDGGPICEDCPPLGYPTDKTRCDECPRHSERT